MPYAAYYIPNGPKNLATLFGDVDFTNVAEYYLEILAGGDVIATTPLNQMDGVCCGERIRVHFVNFRGAVDALNFKVDDSDFEAKSDEWTRPEKFPDTEFIKNIHRRNRFNVKANETTNLICTDYPIEDMAWIDELVASPIAWIEWVGMFGFSDDYLPIVVIDGRVKNKKSVDPFMNAVPLSITFSHDKVIIRN